MLQLLSQILARSEHGERLAVCALVRTRGSTPQKAGAVMVVLDSGQTLGTIGGGCVEAEVKTRAMRQLNIGGSSLHTFNLDHDHGWDDGLVCGGQMIVAVQIVSGPGDAEEYRRVRDRLRDGEPCNLEISVVDERNQPAVFSLPMLPSPRLIIAGAGHVGAALAAMAHLMDFSVIVVDDRADYASAERFPDAVCRVGSVETELAKLRIDGQTYVVIVTRGHRRDALALAAVVRSSAAYIGLIGSKRKIITIFQQLLAEQVSTEDLSRAHAPIGLDIGAVTPAEIAVSIAAELVAVRRAKADQPVLPMRLTREQLDRILSGGESAV
jgi:xanthine dehydrogenase accessory factor